MSLKHLVLALYGTFMFSLGCQTNPANKTEIGKEKTKEKQGIVIPLSNEAYERMTGGNLAELIEKYGERKIIRREEVVHWEFYGKEVWENSAFKNSYTLYQDGVIEAKRTTIEEGKECYQIWVMIGKPPSFGPPCRSINPCELEYEEKVKGGRSCWDIRSGLISAAQAYDSLKNKGISP